MVGLIVNFGNVLTKRLQTFYFLFLSEHLFYLWNLKRTAWSDDVSIMSLIFRFLN